MYKKEISIHIYFTILKVSSLMHQKSFDKFICNVISSGYKINLNMLLCNHFFHKMLRTQPLYI
jgi:hypothetical protein